MNVHAPAGPEGAAARHQAPRPTLIPAAVKNLPHGGLILVLALIVVFAGIRTDSFLSSDNLINVLRQVSVLAVVASALTLLMVGGGMDFSMGSNVAVTMGVAAQLIAHGHSVVLTLVLATAVGTLIGLVNGLVVTYSKVAPFVVTLATALILDGVALIVIDGLSVSIGDELFWLGEDKTLGIPRLTIVAALVLLVTALVMRYTVFGRDAFAIGGNEDVARLSGIRVDRAKLLLYGIGGLLSGLAGIMLLSRLAAASPSPTGGLLLQLQAVAAVVIGGTSLEGGRGTVFGTLLGVLLLGVVANVLNLLQISSNYQLISVGAVLLIAAVSNLLQSRRH